MNTLYHTILIFGSLQDHIQSNTLQLDVVADTDTLRNLLLSKYPALENTTFCIAVDKQLIQSNTPLSPSAEIALLPPYSGG